MRTYLDPKAMTTRSRKVVFKLTVNPEIILHPRRSVYRAFQYLRRNRWKVLGQVCFWTIFIMFGMACMGAIDYATEWEAAELSRTDTAILSGYLAVWAIFWLRILTLELDFLPRSEVALHTSTPTASCGRVGRLPSVTIRNDQHHG